MRKVQSASFFLMLSKSIVALGFLVSITLADGAIANSKLPWQSAFSNWFTQEPNDRGRGGNSGGHRWIVGDWQSW